MTAILEKKNFKRLEVSDGEFGRFDVGSSEEIAKKSKNKKLFKSQKSAKSRKKLSQSRNLPNFNVKEDGPSFLTPETRTLFDRFWLTFIEVLIL